MSRYTLKHLFVFFAVDRYNYSRSEMGIYTFVIHEVLPDSAKKNFEKYWGLQTGTSDRFSAIPFGQAHEQNRERKYEKKHILNRTQKSPH